MLRELIDLSAKEFRLEWRHKTALTGMVIYVVSTVFISYMAFRELIDIPSWNALFWIILVFAAVNAVARSFMQESRGIQLYYYTLLNPVTVIFSKIIYNSCMLVVLSFIHLAFFTLFLGNQIQDIGMFILALVLGSTGLASILTLISAITSKAGGSPSLMAILSFPLLIPLLMVIMRFSKNAIDGIGWTVNSQYALLLLGLFGITLTLGYLLFPYLWRE